VDKPADLIEYETMLLGRHAHMTARARGDEGHLDRTAYVLLSRLRVEGPMSIRQLSEVFGLDVSTLNRKTAAMIAAGLLERIPDADGGIARKFRITGEGETRLDAERAEMVRGLAQVLDGWTAEEAAEFAAYLQRFNAAVERLSGQPWPRP
jgi:DNA-binding MarR family transcriptional regulator